MVAWSQSWVYQLFVSQMDRDTLSICRFSCSIFPKPELPVVAPDVSAAFEETRLQVQLLKVSLDSRSVQSCKRVRAR